MRKPLVLSIFLLALLVPAAEAGSPSRATVVVKDYAFSPSTVVIKKGGSVTFVRRAHARHLIRLSGLTPLGSRGAGNYYYYCQIHAFMRLKVVVRNS